MILSEKAEDNFIQRYFAPLATGVEALGLHDDAAQVPVPDGYSLVVSMDTLVSDVHFFDHDPADTIARKALRVNLSDLASKGCVPHGYFLSLAMPESRLRSESWMTSFSAGLAADQDSFGVRLMGGDTVRSPNQTVISICAFGFVPDGKMVTRSGANPGDRIYVTGTIGDSAVGLLSRQASLFGKSKLTGNDQAIYELISTTSHEQFEKRYLVPEPKMGSIAALSRFASAAMDISDGLVGDANTLANASNVGLQFRLGSIPHNNALLDHLDKHNLQGLLITGGDDYEILCTVPDPEAPAFESVMRADGLPLTYVGDVVAEHGVSFLDRENAPIDLGKTSFDHFS